MLGCLFSIEQSSDIVRVSAVKNIHAEVEQLARVPDALGRFQFVAGEHPHFYVSLVEGLDGALDVFLEAILEDGGSEERELPLPLVIDLVKLRLFVENITLGEAALCHELLRLVGVKHSHRDQQRSVPIHRALLQELFGLVHQPHLLGEGVVVRLFQVEQAWRVHVLLFVLPSADKAFFESLLDNVVGALAVELE